jgi:FlaA1/EpsC-like NDP-sugar epimerase
VKRRPFSNISWWILFGTLWVLAITLGVTGWAQFSALHHFTFDFFDDLYLTIQLISFSSGAVEKPVPLLLNIARFILPFLTLLTAIKAFLDVFQEQIRVIQMRSLRNHIIICGLSRKGMLLAARFRQQGDNVVVIEQDDDNQWLESCRGLGIFIIVGDASDLTILNLAGGVYARGIIAVCDNDGINADILMQVQTLARERASRSNAQPLKALAHITDPQLCELLKNRLFAWNCSMPMNAPQLNC